MDEETSGIDILAIGAHPDDVEISAGGTLLKMIGQGRKVVVCDASNGEPTPYGDPVTRMKEAAAAAEALGAERITLGMRNRYILDTVENRRKVAEVIRHFRPKIILTHYPGGAHPDHYTVAQITEAARFYGKLTKTNMYGQEWPDAPWWAPKLYYYFDLGVPNEQVRPSFIVDISAEWEDKLRVLNCYASQPGPIKQSWRGEEYYGKLIGTQYAEAFFSKEAIGITNLFDLV